MPRRTTPKSFRTQYGAQLDFRENHLDIKDTAGNGVGFMFLEDKKKQGENINLDDYKNRKEKLHLIIGLCLDNNKEIVTFGDEKFGNKTYETYLQAIHMGLKLFHFDPKKQSYEFVDYNSSETDRLLFEAAAHKAVEGKKKNKKLSFL